MKTKILRMVSITCAIIVASVGGLVLTGCNGQTADYTIGINQYLPHPALDLVREGFKERLNELMAEAGKTVAYDHQNAGTDSSTAATINNNFIAKNVDLIFAIATASAQSAKTAAEPMKTPVVYGAITDPVSAGLTGAEHVTGASDALEMSVQIDLVKELLGGEINGKIAYIYTSNEDNTRIQGELLTEAATEKGIDVAVYSINALSDLQTVFTSIAGDTTIKAIYIGTDNLLAENMQQVANLNKASSRSLPIVCADTSMASTGGVAAFGMNYTSVGQASAEQAFEILINGKRPIDVPVHYQTAETLELLINKTLADELNITVPQGLLDKAKTII